MGVYNVASKTTGGIGAIRGVGSKVTFNIPIAYVVEGGITKVVYKEEETIYTPTGDTYNLYNRGTMSEVLGGFTYEGDSTLAYSEEAGYLSLRCTKGIVPNGTITSNHLMNLTGYNYVTIEYEFVNASTGAAMTTLDSAFAINGYNNADGNGQYNFIILNSSPVRIGRSSGFWEETYLVIGPTSTSTPLSSTDDVVLKIYSIVVSKT